VKLSLPDVNTMLALLDPLHLHHEAAHQWYGEKRPLRLMLCPHVIHGVIRVASQPRYPNPLGTCAQVRKVLIDFVKHVKPAFCEQDVSLLDERVVAKPEELTPSRVSDLYLLALAVANGAQFATFDTRIPADAIAGGKAALDCISGG
jgi:predicted nucleic acid-binding protein